MTNSNDAIDPVLAAVADARSFISQAVTVIDALPPLNASLLADAQRLLAQARSYLDEWEDYLPPPGYREIEGEDDE